MTDDPNDPEVLVSLATEAEAVSIVNALAERGIEASATESAAAFPGALGLEGGVQVMVKRADLDRANEALAEIRREFNEIDWSKVDIGEPEEAETE
jgi:hypothetical protein